MSKLRLIQCGVGGHGRTWVKGATAESEDFDLVAIVDPVPKAIQEANALLFDADAGSMPASRCFASLDEAIAKVPADAVLTVAPPALHLAHAKAAFGAGLHLLTEKPIAGELADAREMVRLATAANKQLVVAQNYRYSAAAQRMKSLFDEGRLGEFGHGVLEFFIGADFTGSFRETMEYPLLVDMAIHHMDLIRYVTGRNITRVTAHTFKPAWSWYQHHPGLHMMLELDGGLPFIYVGDWSALGRQTGWNGDWRLQCAKGSLHWQNDGIYVAKCDRWSKNFAQEKVETPPIPLEQQARLLSNFAKAIRTDTPAETNGADNLWSFAAVMAGVKSQQEKRTVEVKELVG